jgi:hypothetical protein
VTSPYGWNLPPGVTHLPGDRPEDDDWYAALSKDGDCPLCEMPTWVAEAESDDCLVKLACGCVMDYEEWLAAPDLLDEEDFYL